MLAVVYKWAKGMEFMSVLQISLIPGVAKLQTFILNMRFVEYMEVLTIVI